jgi:hypothetical protein
MQYLVQFKQGSTPAGRKVIYRLAWGMGFRKVRSSRHKIGQDMKQVFLVRCGMNAPQHAKLEDLFGQSVSVASWQKQ